MEAILEPLLKIGGVTALVMGVFRQILSLGIFAKLDATQTFAIVTIVAVLVWSVAMASLFLNKDGTLAFVAGSNNSIQQGTRRFSSRLRRRFDRRLRRRSRV